MNPDIVLILSKHHPILIQSIKQKGYKPHVFLNKPLSDLDIAYDSVKGIVTSNSCFMPPENIVLFPNLQFIGRLGSGMEIIDTAFAASRDIECFASPQGNANAVAEQALGMLLALLNNTHRSQNELLSGVFERNGNMGRELYDLKVGIIGFGNNGRQFAHHLHHFGCDIYVYDINPNIEAVPDYVHFGNNINAITMHCDCISFHIPINDVAIQTAEDILAQMKQSFILINCARGGLISIDRLHEYLSSGRISGAAIDVWEEEPLSSLNKVSYDKALAILGMPNVIGTPHIAGYTHQAFFKMSKIIGEKIPPIDSSINLF